MLPAEAGDGVEVEGVAEGVGEHDGLGAGAQGRRDAADVDVVGAQFDIDEDRHGAVLQNGVDGGGEAGCHADDLVAGLDGALAQLG